MEIALIVFLTIQICIQHVNIEIIPLKLVPLEKTFTVYVHTIFHFITLIVEAYLSKCGMT